MRIPMNNIFYVVIFLATPGLLCAQEADYFLGPVRYSFINYDKNVFQLPENDTTFQQLFFRFDSLVVFGKGNIQIVHLGGSHIQADMYTHVMRTRLQSLSLDMNGGRGLIFPYSMAHTNNPSNYSVRYTGNWEYCKNIQQNSGCTLGLTGMAVYTHDNLSRITINPNTSDSTNYCFDKVRVFHEPTPYQLSAVVGNTNIPGYYDTLAGCTVFEYNEPARVFQLEIEKDSLYQDLGFALLGIELIHNGPGLMYHALGVNGAMLSSFLRCELYEKHLKAINPGLVVISIGTNDGYTRRFDEDKYKREYRELLTKTLEAVPDAALLLTVPNDSYLYRRYANTNTEKMEKIILELAREYNCAVWDFYEIMGGLNSAQTWYNMGLMRYDRIHFNKKGYRLKGELFFSAFLKAWEQHLNINTTKSITKDKLSSEN